MANCRECLHLDVCKTADSCDGQVPGCKHYESKERYSLEKIARKICDSYEECNEGECPGIDYCDFRKRNGVFEWLKKVVEG